MGLDHSKIDERNRVLHQTIAERLKNDPSLVKMAKENLRWKIYESFSV